MTFTTAFAGWDLHPDLLAGLQDQGFEQATPVQAQSYPAVLTGRDLLVQSRTGTGKTLAFGLPILQRLAATAGQSDAAKALVILPTRELAMQVASALGRMGRPLGIEVAALYGGGAYRDQLRAIGRGARLVVGTPGRLVDHLERGRLDLGSCRTLVLDEADEMLDMGFAEELDRIVSALPAERQTLMFSATLAPGTAELATRTLRDPVRIELSEGGKAAPDITHVAYEVLAEHKEEALVNVLHADHPALAIVFCHTKAETEQLAERLREEGFEAAHLNGDLPQEARSRTLGAFRRGALDVLVATDVAARGIDVKGVTHVYNLGVPRDPESYIHRVGRTGRAGAKGEAVTFVAPRDAGRFRRMLENAGVPVALRLLPQAAEVRKRLRERLHENLVERVSAGVEPDVATLSRELLGYLEPLDLVAALLAEHATARIALTAGSDIPVPRRPERVARPRPEVGPPRGVTAGGRPGGPAPGRVPVSGFGRAQAPAAGPEGGSAAGGEDAGYPAPRRRLSEHHEPGFTRVWLSQGKAHGLTRGGLVKLVCGLAEIRGEAIGAIALHPFFSFFDVRDADAPRVVERLSGLSYKGKVLRANLVPPATPPA
ncbi:MAG: DEAD/DEAH box helicase [Candidatus Sericytochromatia bacterium]|nr:DEAD/DEAH box helicase [Candidatus Sericytochromatia bacterium]